MSTRAVRVEDNGDGTVTVTAVTDLLQHVTVHIGHDRLYTPAMYDTLDAAAKRADERLRALRRESANE